MQNCVPEGLMTSGKTVEPVESVGNMSFLNVRTSAKWMGNKKRGGEVSKQINDR